MVATETLPAATPIPPTPLLPEPSPPVQLPLRGWTVAPDGAVFVVDAAGRLHHLSADRLSSADERDPAVARDYVVFLSNGAGLTRTYRSYPPYDIASAFGSSSGLQVEAHPSALDDAVGATLVFLPDADWSYRQLRMLQHQGVSLPDGASADLS
jgi:hypothetical protein